MDGEITGSRRAGDAAGSAPRPKETKPAGPDPSDELIGYFFPEFEIWRPILARLRIAPGMVLKLASRATANGTDFQSELLASDLVSERDLFATIADEFAVGFLEEIDPDRLIMKPEDRALFLRSRSKHLHAWVMGRNGVTHPVIAPSGMRLTELGKLLRSNRLKPILYLTSPSALRRAILARASMALVKKARNGLHERFPALSAKDVISPWQAAMLAVLLVTVPLSLVVATWEALLALHVLSSLFFLACVGLRFAAATAQPASTPSGLERIPADTLPFYSVLVALHRESEVVSQLVGALERLEWPRSKLEIKLVCEADDFETLAALSALRLPHHVEVVRVPPSLPRTKPKALDYALPLVKGDFVVLYDAEDRPHRLQLREAWHRFASAGDELACLQAPLQISNGGQGVIPLLFAFEYTALFRGLLPWLSGRRTPLPLGGTSNHFRVVALEAVGGWDPYNVTEDADLGLRLARFGYRCETISLPTLEDAPVAWSVWLPQRTRWFKGWLQTWLVHMRDPVALHRDLGVRSFCIAQILYAGLALSVLIHPLLIVAAIYLTGLLLLAEPVSGWPVLLLTMDALNIVCGYLSFLLLGWHSLGKRDRRGFWRILLFTPPYWMMMSWAAWRAVWQLWRRPHHCGLM
jgi:cellulose synthase/poly-beta-1,6-N-acetylglucosamine synthase-like glycosyltransferase